MHKNCILNCERCKRPVFYSHFCPINLIEQIEHDNIKTNKMETLIVEQSEDKNYIIFYKIHNIIFQIRDDIFKCPCGIIFSSYHSSCRIHNYNEKMQQKQKNKKLVS